MKTTLSPLRGSETSLQLDLFQPVTLTSAASSISEPMISPDTTSAISSPESAAGLAPSGLPGGPMLDLFGLALAPASPSVPPVNKAEALMSDIFGLRGFGSSASVALTQSLANRLRERLGSDGSIEFSQTWRRKVTPAGRRYWAHTASARRTSGSGCSGWRTPQRMDGERGPTLNADPKAGQHSLTTEAQLAGWPTPAQRDEKGGYPNGRIRNGGISTDTLDVTARLAGWATPRTTDAEKNVRTPEGAARKIARKGAQNDLGLVTGLVPSGSPASTARRGALNPAFSRWLMGFPPAWDDCAATATPSSRKPRPSSLKRSSK